MFTVDSDTKQQTKAQSFNKWIDNQKDVKDAKQLETNYWLIFEALEKAVDADEISNLQWYNLHKKLDNILTIKG